MICIAALLAIAAVFFAIHDMLSRTIPSMFKLAVGSMLIAAIPAAMTLRWTEKREFGVIRASALCGLSVFMFFSTWIVLWFVSEQLLINHNLRVLGDGDNGYNYFYPGASGMGYAEGLARPDKIISRVIWVGSIGTLLLSVPFGAILTAFKRPSK